MITPQEYANYVNQLNYMGCPDFQTKIDLLHEFIKDANTTQLKEAIRLTTKVKGHLTSHHYENLLTTLDIKRAEESAQAVVNGSVPSFLVFQQSVDFLEYRCESGDPLPNPAGSSNNFLVAFRNKIPIDDMEKRGHVFRPPVLVFEIIGVLPHVNPQQWLPALADG